MSDAPNEGREERQRIEDEAERLSNDWSPIKQKDGFYYGYIRGSEDQNNRLRDQLSKEREMRKELVVVSGEMKKIYSKYAHDDPYEDHVFEYLESLIAKASELDKNQ